uniref:Glypican-5 n=1 Tax=Cacopsylla melanoneura TaxID=428564 RepID=A0A8D8UWE1_9HEMI
MFFKSSAVLVLISSCLICLTHCASVAKLGQCDNLRSTFTNASVPEFPVEGSHLKVCSPGKDSKTCCTAALEEQLKQKARQELKLRLAQHTSALEDTLTQSGEQIHGQIKDMIIKSRNKTLTVVRDAYDSIVYESSDLINRFYENIIDFIAIDSSRPVDSTSKDIDSDINIDNNQNIDSKVESNNKIGELNKIDTINVDNSRIDKLRKDLDSFFHNLFPIIYKNLIRNNKSSQFNPDYNQCLINMIYNINPYNNINKLITKELVKNLKSIKILFNSIYFGMNKVGEINEMIDGNLRKECVNVLTRMNYCHKCSDVDSSGTLILNGIRPCANYCTNVLNACFAGDMSVINLAWNSYLQSMVTFVQAILYGQSNVNIEDVLQSLHSRISETIMYAMQEAHNIDNKVRYACGPPKYTDDVGVTTSATDGNEVTTTAKTTNNGLRTLIWADLDNYSLKFNEKITEFSENIERYKSFYTNLSRKLCEEASGSAERGKDDKSSQQCWNGQTVGPYTKTVASPGLGQKYNPEMTWNPDLSLDPKLAQIIDGLRHTKQIVLSQLAFTTEPESYRLPQDQEGEGSGAGSRIGGGGGADRGEYTPPDDEEGEEEWKEGGSGSGDGGDGRPRILEEPKVVDPSNPANPTSTSGNSTVDTKSAATSSLVTVRTGAIVYSVLLIVVFRHWTWS